MQEIICIERDIIQKLIKPSAKYKTIIYIVYVDDYAYRRTKRLNKKRHRPSELSKETSYQIKKELKESNKGWTTKNRGERVNHIKKSDIKYHYTHIYRILRKWI